MKVLYLEDDPFDADLTCHELARHDGTWKVEVVRSVGEARARDLILTGRLVRAGTGYQYGLVHDVVDAGALDRTVRARAEAIAQHPPVAVGLAKTLCGLSADADAATSFRLEGVVQQLLMTQPDLATRFPAALAFIKDQIARAE